MKSFVLIFSVLFFSPQPIKIKFLNFRGGKPPLKFNHISFFIDNKSIYSQWYIFPSNLDQAMPDSIDIPTQKIECIEYLSAKNNTQKLIKVEFDYNFIGFLVPPNSTIEIENFLIESWAEETPPPYFEVWEAKDVLINNKSSLKNWFPFEIMSSENVFISNIGNKHTDGSKYSGWNYEKKEKRANMPLEQIESINIKLPTKYKISIEH